MSLENKYENFFPDLAAIGELISSLPEPGKKSQKVLELLSN